MLKIAILGVGGVGGYFGGLLARFYKEPSETEIHFISRGANLKTIRDKGLQLQTQDGNFTVFPKSVKDDATTLGPVDYLLCCTKSYHLEDAVRNASGCIGKNTVIIPMLNGVDAPERIKAILPGHTIWNACVYLVAKLNGPGIVSQTGNVKALFFGSEEVGDSRPSILESIFRKAGLDVTATSGIKEKAWEKFVFISPLATTTSFLDITSAEVLNTEEGKKIFLALHQEVLTVASEKGIKLPEDIITKTPELIGKIPAGTTTSMHRDFQSGNPTELESLRGYVSW